MSYTFKQFRYFGNNNSKNNISLNELKANNFLQNRFNYIVQLGIQTTSGLKFYINGNSEPVIINTSGIFDLDFLNKDGVITQLRFNSSDITNFLQNGTGYILIDVVGEEVN